MSLSPLIFSPIISKLLRIPFSVFLISKNCCFTYRSFTWAIYTSSCLYLIFWTYEITTILMFLSNSNVCVSSGLVSIDSSLSPLWAVCLCFFACLINFVLMTGVVNFTWLGVYSYKHSWVCSGMLLQSSEIFLFFWVFKICWVDQSSA